MWRPLTLLFALLATPALAQETVVDFSSLSEKPPVVPEICSHAYTPDFTSTSGSTVKMLGAAYVYMGPSNGLSVLGHAALRFIYCRNQELIDTLFEYSKPEGDALDPALMEDEYGIRLSDYSEAEQAAWKNSLFVYVTIDPEHVYRTEQVRVNRTIFEAWLDIDGKTMLEMFLANLNRYKEQKRRIQNHVPLEEYKVFAHNCTEPIKQDLEIAAPDFDAPENPLRSMPRGLFEKIKKQGKVKEVVIYPSQTELRYLRRKEKHRSNTLQAFVPTSEVLNGTFRGSWVLIYDRKSRVLLRPLIGAVNMAAGVGETVYGLVSAPFRKKNHFHRFKAGLRDTFKSIPETLFLKVRYPQTTPWHPDEITYLRNLERKSAWVEWLDESP